MASTSFDDSNWAGYDEYDSNSAVVDNGNDNLMIDLASLASADFWSNVASDGGDIRVTNSAGDTAYSYELENFDSGNQTGILFFNSQGLSTSSTTTYRVYAGNSSASLPSDSDTLGAENVWTTRFKLVSHDGGSTDSTSNDNGGSAQGGVTAGNTTGQIGEATKFDGNDDGFRLSSSPVPNSTTLTYSAWITIDNKDNDDLGIFSQASSSTNGPIRLYADASTFFSSGDPGEMQLVDGGPGSEIVRASNDELNTNQLYFVQGVLDGSNAYIYIDGTQVASASYSNNFDAAIGIGYSARSNNPIQHHDGKIDEARIVDEALSSNYISTEYENQANNSNFWTNQGWTANVTDTPGSVLESDGSGVLVSDGNGVLKTD